MRPLFCIFLPVFLLLITPEWTVTAQNTGPATLQRDVPKDDKPQSPDRHNLLFHPEWHINVGSSFSYSPLFGSISGFSVTPALSMPLTSRISLTGGAMINQFGNGFMNRDLPNASTSGMVSVFGTASYQVNDKLLLFGSAIKHLGGHLPNAMLPFSPAFTDQFILGSELKLGDHLTVGAAFRVNSVNTNGYYGLNPWYDPYGPFQQWRSPFSVQP